MLPSKKPRLDADVAVTLETPPPPTGLVALPPALANTVIDFLAGDDYYHGNGRHYWSRQLEPLPTLAQVSKSWRDMAAEPASTRILATFRFKLKERMASATRSEMLAIRRVLILRRAYIQRLILEDLPDFGSESEGMWHAALSHAPRLQSLDMDTGDVVRPPTSAVLAVSHAAARHCPRLQSLMFPSTMSRPLRQPARHYMRTFNDGVLECLPAWTPHGGLRHLRLTLREREYGDRIQTYLDTIATSCPQIEILDGFASTVETDVIATCEERWRVDLDAWTRFCTTCTNLKYFDWITVPFATRFFEIFAATPKPQLVNLTFSLSSAWGWRRYFATVGPATRAVLEATGYGGTAVNAHAVLQACPNLRGVRVEWFEHLGATELHSHPSMRKEIFGDDFCEALVRHCRGLTRLQHGPVPSSSHHQPSASIVTLTDRSFRALATLPMLCWVEIVGANITADGLFELVIHHAATTRHERVYYIVLGDDTEGGVTSMVFYDVLQGFLERLLAYDGDLPCASRPVMLQLENANKSVLEEGLSAAWFSSVLLTVEKLQRKYPTLQLSGLVRDYNEEYGVIKRVVEFAFATASAQLPEWSEDAKVVDAADDELEGGVFMNRQYYGRDLDLPGHQGSRRNDDEIEDDSEEEEEEEDGESEVEGFGVVDGDEIVFDDDDEVNFSDDDDDEFISDDESVEIDLGDM